MTIRLPDFLIVGAARCGTSWLAKNISTHPDVFVPPYKEVHFFDRHLEKGIEWYGTCFSDRVERLVGEATPAYLYFEQIPGLIHRYVPEVKILVILRNPVDRAYSHYWNLVAKARRKGKDQYPTFEDKISAATRIIEEGLYTEKLERYYELFPAENIKVLFYDDLTDRPRDLLQEVWVFLEIDQDYETRRVANRVNASDTKLGKLRSMYWLPPVLSKLGMGRVAEWVETRSRPALSAMKEETRAMLLDRYYAPEIERLEEMFGRDLRIWKG